MRAAEKTNPMNAASQEPGKAFLDAYIQNAGMEQGQTAFNIFDLFGGGTKKGLEAGDAARRGEGPEYDAEGSRFVGGMLNRNRATQEAIRRSRGK
jgi:hypothetical protein